MKNFYILGGTSFLSPYYACVARFDWWAPEDHDNELGLRLVRKR